MKCNLIVEINELTVRDYTIVEEEGILSLLAAEWFADLSFSYEGEDEPEWVLVIKAQDLGSLLRFLSFFSAGITLATIRPPSSTIPSTIVFFMAPLPLTPL